MQSKDLRIGNMILINERVYGCVSGTINEIALEEISPKKVNEWKPIFLNENWLKNFGAKKFNHAFLIDRFRLIPRPEYGFFTVVDKETNVYISKVEFLHEWQNLYFALNGKELELKHESKP
jgi:hypothetical protein